ncbi:hypothetical protein B5M42_001410 [Paenibacillus athensensis]|uniref:Uncharacterized protein n=1 Tax=Paenibacillus athensensis TaxID=1967502 RepID=A0A4Y8QBK1_9BACL|nr:hypothetical protein [Paenibacillus athensensis]MCD1257495.1 hypothetical protein [Paenibacillus athensensis]
MSSRFKVRAYCSARGCDYIHKEDVVQAIDYASSYSVAQMLNAAGRVAACPACGAAMQFYSHAVIDEFG